MCDKKSIYKDLELWSKIYLSRDKGASYKEIEREFGVKRSSLSFHFGTGKSQASQEFKQAIRNLIPDSKPISQEALTKKKEFIKNTCSVEGCNNFSRTKGLCSSHYKKLLKYGDPSTEPKRAKRGESKDFILNAVNSDTDECIIWPYGKKDNVGRVVWEGKARNACRVTLMLSNNQSEEDVSDLKLLRRNGCNNKSCINPNHTKWSEKRESTKIELEYPYTEYWTHAYMSQKKSGREKGRRNVTLVNRDTKERSSTSYARYLMSVHLKRMLNEDEHVDHINEDKTDDRIENYQILTLEQNNLKSAQSCTYLKADCPACGKTFFRRKNCLSKSQLDKLTPLSCSKECGYKTMNMKNVSQKLDEVSIHVNEIGKSYKNMSGKKRNTLLPIDDEPFIL